MNNTYRQLTDLDLNILIARRLGYGFRDMPDHYVAFCNPEGVYLRTLRFDGNIGDVWGLLFKTGFLPDYARRIEAAVDLAKEAQLIITVDGFNWVVSRKLVDLAFVKNTSLPRAICEAWLLWKDEQS